MRNLAGIRVAHEFDLPFEHGVDELWSLVSDTQRVNELAGNPKYDVYEVAHEKSAAIDVFGRLRFPGFKIEWQEVTPNWIENRWFEQQRRFLGGPLISLGAEMEIIRDGERCYCHARLTVASRYWLGRFIALRVAHRVERSLRTMIAEANRGLDTKQPIEHTATVRVPSAAKARAKRLAQKIESTPYGHGLAHQLVEYLLTAQEVDLWTLRPLALARRWGVAERPMVELCLQAVRAGLLESRWDLLCPRCRLAKADVVRMDALPDGAHCESCNIDYKTDFARNVELAFSPAAAIRPVEYGFFCRSGPVVTPHIKGQITLAPGESKSVPISFSLGEYRLRTLEAGPEVDLAWHAGGFPRVQVTNDTIGVGNACEAGQLDLANAGTESRTVIVEDQSWRREILTAQRVTTFQAFRDLFSEQVIRPGDEIAISTITFMFSDLAGSTALFERVGDAKAYQLVREHFALLARVVREHNGTIVKTIGDGIHAAFNTPDDAFEAAVAAQRSVMKPSDGEVELAIRIGLHNGSSISVTLNGRIDYYGSAVNLAARLEGQGNGGQITMSAAFVDDPAVQGLLPAFEVSQRQVELKGFEEPVTIFQISP